MFNSSRAKRVLELGGKIRPNQRVPDLMEYEYDAGESVLRGGFKRGFIFPEMEVSSGKLLKSLEQRF